MNLSKPKNFDGIFLSELARGIGVSYPTLIAWLPGVGAKLKHIKADGKGGYYRAVMTHEDAAAVQAYAAMRKRIKQARGKK